jgi:tetratricopeptide (TPR) repeat protein
VHAEERHPVMPLALPTRATRQDADALASVDAVALFSERARARDPDFRLGEDNAAAVAEVCRRVDGLPLAIELAAARCELLSPLEIAEGLVLALGALGGGPRDAPARQRTLRATIDWSHELLSDAEKQCFARFAVFAGGASIEAAVAITGAEVDVLHQLVAKNLLTRREDADAVTRLGMLETIRAYAAARFMAGADHEAVCERHYRHYLALAQRHGTEPALSGPRRREHLARLDTEIDNFHLALAWAVRRPSAEPALEMCAALGHHWLSRDRYADGVHWIDQALNLPRADEHAALRVHALCFKAMCLWTLRRGDEEPEVLAELEATARALAEPAILARALRVLADRQTVAGRLDLADRLADEALSRAAAVGDRWEVATASSAKAIAASDIAELREWVEKAASLMDGAGNVVGRVELLGEAARVALSLGGERDALEFVQRAMPIARALDSPYLSILLLADLGVAALFTGDADGARHAFRDELRLARDIVVPAFAFEGFLGLAAVAALEGELPRAARLAGAAAAHLYELNKDPVDHRLEATFIQPARRRHGAGAWDAAARDGASLSFEDAIAFALEEPRT